jgi:hypothetical protein
VTTCYITIDTEYDFGFTRRLGVGSRRANFERSILAAVRGTEAGIRYEMDVLDKNGLKGVFFVDPLPALVWGTGAIEDIVGLIVERGHDVQLHAHTEWLDLAGTANPIGNHTGTNIKDFTFEEQCTLLDYARHTLVAAGAPAPVAFRAGNYGANDDTLRALAEVGLVYDTSHCPGITNTHSACAIGLTPDDRAITERHVIIEVPVGCIGSRHGGFRHAQVTAISAAELSAAIRFCIARGIDCFSLVMHSFELLSRDRTRVNKLVRHRFETMCAALKKAPGATTGTYVSHPPHVDPRANGDQVPMVPFNTPRWGARMAAQLASNVLYGRR